ncbi:MAG: M20/M25/M40 family metallo-hydrolase, partial [Moorella sp. (in: Bacteria)]|nr:M20/M25/M40 family metallo-hydrolase [Moorella sp. (in: firmicutes)]
ERIGQEMKKLRFDDVFLDSMGNIVGRIGNGPRVLLYDSHIDTVDIADSDQWQWDPYQGKIENGIFYGLGAGDEKNSTPGMVYGLKIMKDLGLTRDFTLYYFGNIEEICDGVAPNSLVVTDKIKPDFVVIGEPTKMNIYRGHRGRVELKVTTKGRTCHASAPERGVNAV